MEQDESLAPFAVWGCKEGEEYVPKFLFNEAVKGEELDLNLATDSRVPGRIKGHDKLYKEIDEEPPDSFTCNNKSALLNKEFVLEELLRLEHLGCIERVDQQPKVVLPLSAVFSKKWRLVVDASRTLNPYCTRRKIMLEDLSRSFSYKAR